MDALSNTMARDSRQVLIPPAAASDQRRLSLQIPESPSSSVFPPSPSNPGGVQRRENDLDFSDLWVRWYQSKFKVESDAGTGNNVTTAHATSGVNHPPQTSRPGRWNYGDGPQNPIEIYDDESGDEQQTSGPIPPAPSNPAPVADMGLDAASLVKHEAARPDDGCQRDPRPFAEPNNDHSKCFSHDDPRRAASSQDETGRKSDGRYRSASHDHHGDGHQRSGSACHPSPVPDQTGEPTEDDPVRLRRVREHHASPSVIPDHQSISEPKPSDARPHVRYQSSPSAASEDEEKTQHRSGSSALPQHLDHHGDGNQTNGLNQDDARPPGDNQRPVGDGVEEHDRGDVTQPPRKRRRMSTSTPVVDETAPKRRASSRPQRAQRPTIYRATPYRRRRRNPKQAETEYREVEAILGVRSRYLVKWEGYGHKDNTWEPVRHFEQCPELLLQFYQRIPEATQVATARPTQLEMSKPCCAGLASKIKRGRRKYFNVEEILRIRLEYLVMWKGYGPEDNSWVPVEHFNQCPELLQQFHERTEPVWEWIAREFRALRPPCMGAYHSAA